VKKAKLPLFAGQQCHIIESDLRSVALIVSGGVAAGADFLGGMLQGNARSYGLGDFGQALGLSLEQLHAAEPLPARSPTART